MLSEFCFYYYRSSHDEDVQVFVSLNMLYEYQYLSLRRNLSKQNKKTVFSVKLLSFSARVEWRSSNCAGVPPAGEAGPTGFSC